MTDGFKLDSKTKNILNKSIDEPISADEGKYLLNVEGSEMFALLATADELRKEIVGDDVTFINNCNINFTNICTLKCGFCAFGKDKNDSEAYFLSDEEILAKAQRAYENGAKEFCLMGGVHENVDLYFYEDLLKLLKTNYPKIEIHGFSPTMIYEAANESGVEYEDSLKILKKAGLGTLPGTAAEILNDKTRKIVCPKKVSVKDWIEIIEIAHEVGIPTSATIMYGHVEKPEERIDHIQILKNIQERTHGFTEFIPMTFMGDYAPITANNNLSLGASGLDDLKLFAISRLMLRDIIKNIQVSWVKLGFRLAQISLSAGANDLGGTLMEDELSGASGAPDGIGVEIEKVKTLIKDVNRVPAERNSTYTEISYFQMNNLKNIKEINE